MPQIEVTFDIDANGILHVNARDKATGKENKITIKANSGLSEAEIAAMVKDAEANAADDKKKIELVQAKNSAEALVHQMKKALAEHGDKVPDEKAAIEAAIKDLEEVQKGEDKAAIEAKTEALMKVSQKLGEKMYADAQAAQAGAGMGAADGGMGGMGGAGAAGGPGAGAGGAPGGAAGGGAKKDDSNVVDAEYTEVKDKKA